MINFYNWSKKSETPIYTFLEEHCSDLLKDPLKDRGYLGLENTSIPVNLFNLEKILSDKDNIFDCSIFSSERILKRTKIFEGIKLGDNSLVYAFINKDSKRMYIGSSVNPTTRLHTYSFSWKKARQRFLLEMREKGGGFFNYLFYTGLEVPNYKNKFISIYPQVFLDPKLTRILDFFLNSMLKFWNRL